MALALVTAGIAPSAMAQTSEAEGMSASEPSASTAKSNVASADRSFAMHAAKGGMAEVALGQMAQQKAENASVKQFAAQMVEDHTKANDELKSIASGKGITLPAAAAPDATERHLQSLSGAEFDRRYMAAMLTDHKKTIALFEKEAKRGPDSDLRAFAQKTLPTLQHHLQMVKDAQAGLPK